MKNNLPKKIYLMRHLLSEGNVDRTVYDKTPDHQIPLYQKNVLHKDHLLTLASSGFPAIINERYNKENYLEVKTSKYLRTLQTLEKLEYLVNVQSILKNTTRTDSLLHEIRCKLNLTATSEEYLDNLAVERENYGSFYHTWPGGESPLQVHQRCLTWWNNYRLNSLLSSSKQSDLLVISHNQTLQELVLILTKNHFHSFENGQVLELTLNPLGGFYTITNNYIPLVQIKPLDSNEE